MSAEGPKASCLPGLWRLMRSAQFTNLPIVPWLWVEKQDAVDEECVSGVLDVETVVLEAAKKSWIRLCGDEYVVSLLVFLLEGQLQSKNV